MEGSVVDVLPEPKSTNTKAGKLVGRLMVAVQMMEHWQYVLDEATIAQSTILAGQSAVKKGRPLPKAYEESLAILERVLQEHLANLCFSLDGFITSSETFNKFESWLEVRFYSLPPFTRLRPNAMCPGRTC